MTNKEFRGLRALSLGFVRVWGGGGVAGHSVLIHIFIKNPISEGLGEVRTAVAMPRGRAPNK